MRIARLFLVFLVTLTTSLFASSLAPSEQAQSQHASHNSNLPQSLIEKVRRATEAFRDSRQAPPDYVPALGCVSGPEQGAMGVHFINFGLLNDGGLQVDQPEALIYEFKNGVGRLVGVEYIVKAAAWFANPENTAPPVLEGQLLQFVDAPNRFGLDPFFELHVWAWQENPNGAFVDWNPHVSCEGQ